MLAERNKLADMTGNYKQFSHEYSLYSKYVQNNKLFLDSKIHRKRFKCKLLYEILFNNSSEQYLQHLAF